MASVRRMTNGIQSLRIDGVQVDDVEGLKEHVEDYFKTLFRDDRPVRPKVDGLLLPQLGEGQAVWLERPFLEEKVKKVVWSMESDKAPDPDGFTLVFYKACWEVIREDLMQVFNGFHEKCFFG